LIATGAVAAYANTFGVPFVFDDVASILDNPTIRTLWPPGQALTPPSGWGLTVSGRPLLNLSLAINYAISGTAVWSYHAFNLLVHILAGLTLFGLVRRTLLLPRLREVWGGRSDACAIAVAAVWTLHPLQTESVTYVIQRAESLMGLWFLAALYAFARSAGSGRATGWRVAAILAALLGVATKEVAALIPVMVFLYDRTFVSGSFGQAWRRHRAVHVALACTWVPLAALVLSTGGNRGDTMGFDVGVAWTGFWLTQFEAVGRYLLLGLWPHPLVFDYGNGVTATWREAWPWLLPVTALAVATLVALVRRPVAGFLGIWFFAILAPTSLVPSVVQAIVEHRMYLPLAAVVVAVVIGASRWMSSRAIVIAGFVTALLAGVATHARNATYATDESLWRDTVEKRPLNARAHNNLGRALELQGRMDEAAEAYRQATDLEPQYGQAHYNLGLALFRLGQPAEALPHFDRTVEILPHHGLAYLNKGLVLRALGRSDESLEALTEAVARLPESAEAHFHLAVANAGHGRTDEALIHYRSALRVEPGHVASRLNLGILLGQEGRLDAAVAEFTEAARWAPESPEVFSNLGTALLELRRHDEALAAFERALNLRPDDPRAHYNVGYTLLVMNRWVDARQRFEQALHLDAGFAPARTMLENMAAAPR
jgi:tetratricopeptide (TPR) repeat protein